MDFQAIQQNEGHGNLFIQKNLKLDRKQRQEKNSLKQETAENLLRTKLEVKSSLQLFGGIAQLVRARDS